MFATLLILACNTTNDTADPYKEGRLVVDDGGDGFLSDEDCDDSDANTFPGAAPNDSTTDCMKDLDGDDYGDRAPINPNVTPGTDCDDDNPTTFPGQGCQAEICFKGRLPSSCTEAIGSTKLRESAVEY